MLRKGRNLGCGQSTEHQGNTAIVDTPASSSDFLYGHLRVELGEPGLCSKCVYPQSHPPDPTSLCSEQEPPHFHFSGHPTLVPLLL